MSTEIKHFVVTGGAGFIGSHLCEALVDAGHRVTAIDNLCTGRHANIRSLSSNDLFTLRTADITQSAALADLDPITHIAHLACPASPKANLQMPLDTIRASSVGTLNMLDLAARHDARIVCLSSSEIYGDPLVHPQHEEYRGNCDPIGMYSAYTEGKRVLEAAAAAHQRQGTRVGIIRPFNVYGPRLWPDDGRVVAAFCAAALNEKTLTLSGGGLQTRSLTYIADFIDGLLTMLDSEHFGPINLGSEDEVTIAELANTIIDCAGRGRVEIGPGRPSEVSVRRPDTARAQTLLGWEPTTPLRQGLEHTLKWMSDVLAEDCEVAR